MLEFETPLHSLTCGMKVMSPAGTNSCSCLNCNEEEVSVPSGEGCGKERGRENWEDEEKFPSRLYSWTNTVPVSLASVTTNIIYDKGDLVLSLKSFHSRLALCTF